MGDSGWGAPPSTFDGDPNMAAVEDARLDSANTDWLRQVAGMVDGRLDMVHADWRGSPDRDALRAAGFGLLLGLLAKAYPHARPVLAQVAESHPSFGTLPAGRRLATLEQLSGDGDLVAQWVGPLLGVHDPGQLRPLYTFGGEQ